MTDQSKHVIERQNGYTNATHTSSSKPAFQVASLHNSHDHSRTPLEQAIFFEVRLRGPPTSTSHQLMHEAASKTPGESEESKTKANKIAKAYKISKPDIISKAISKANKIPPRNYSLPMISEKVGETQKHLCRIDRFPQPNYMEIFNGAPPRYFAPNFNGW